MRKIVLLLFVVLALMVSQQAKASVYHVDEISVDQLFDNAVETSMLDFNAVALNTVAGNADILIAPDLEAGNMINKSMEYFAKAEKSGVIMGAKAPLVLTSRASSDKSKMHSIALGVLVVQNLI